MAAAWSSSCQAKTKRNKEILLVCFIQASSKPNNCHKVAEVCTRLYVWQQLSCKKASIKQLKTVETASWQSKECYEAWSYMAKSWQWSLLLILHIHQQSWAKTQGATATSEKEVLVWSSEKNVLMWSYLTWLTEELSVNNDYDSPVTMTHSIWTSQIHREASH